MAEECECVKDGEVEGGKEFKNMNAGRMEGTKEEKTGEKE